MEAFGNKYSPSQISAMILAKMKVVVDDHLSDKVGSAVIITSIMTSTFNLKSVEGSYTKIIKLWRRKGDGAHISILAPF